MDLYWKVAKHIFNPTTAKSGLKANLVLLTLKTAGQLF